MNKLKERFTKNGLQYRLISRTDKVALFELQLRGQVVGYEVARVLINEARMIAGRSIPEGESITGNESFGYDGSKSFFPHDRELAQMYFIEFDNELAVKESNKQAKSIVV